MVLDLLVRCRKPNAKNTDHTISADSIARELGKVLGMTPEAFKAAIGKKGLKALSDGMSSIFFDAGIKASEVKMSDQTRIDRKNAGMSTVAELLGLGHAVCYARPMKLKGPDGKLLADRTSFWHGASSENYTDIDKALKDYHVQQEKLWQRMQTRKEQLKHGDQSPKAQVEQYVTRFDMEKMKQNLLKVKAAADKYALEKRAELESKHKRPEDDPYVKARIEAAEEISRFAAESQSYSQEEKEFLASNERRSLEQIARTAAAQNHAAQNNTAALGTENIVLQQNGPVRNSNP